MCFDQTDPSRPSLHVHLARIVLKNLADTSDAELLFGHVAACFAPKGLWYEQSFCSTAAESVQTVRRQTAHFESQSDPQTHSHEVDGQLDDRGFQEGRQRRCQLDEGAFEQGCHRWCLTSHGCGNKRSASVRRDSFASLHSRRDTTVATSLMIQNVDDVFVLDLGEDING